MSGEKVAIAGGWGVDGVVADDCVAEEEARTLCGPTLFYPNNLGF